MKQRMVGGVFRYGMAALVGVALSGAASAEIYRWKDAKGQVHYGDQPPAGAERVSPHGTSIRGADKPEVPPLPDTKLSDDTVVPDCDSARDQLAEFQTAGDIIETDSLGDQRTLDADQRARLIQRQEAIVARACGAA